MRVIFTLFFLILLVGGPVLAKSNPAPIIKTVRVEPLLFNAATGLRVEPVLMDGESGYRFEYRWFLNGEELLFETSDNLSGDLLRRDDEVALEVTPIDDAGSKLVPFMSLPIKAVNVSPTIDSAPPVKFGKQGFQYQVFASDRDGDRLNYRLEGAPPNMAIDTSTGLLTWAYETLPEGIFDVLLIVEDGFGGRAEQSLELNLSYVTKGSGINE